MRDVAGVTLLCVDTANHALALRALAVSGAELRFEQTLFLTDSIPAHLHVPPGISVIPITRLASRDEYSRFVLKSLLAHVDDAACPADPMGWLRRQPGCVRTRIPRLRLHRREVVLVRRRHARRQRRLLAAIAQAARSAAGSAHRARRSRGRYDRARLSAVARARVRDSLCGRRDGRPLRVRSRVSDGQAIRLSRPLQLLPCRCRRTSLRCSRRRSPTRSHDPATRSAIAKLYRAGSVGGSGRDREAKARGGARDGEARSLLTRAETAMASGPSVGRNDPCPCGSGKRYKQCHGTLGAEDSSARTATAAAPVAATVVAGPVCAGARAARRCRAPARRHRRSRARVPRSAAGRA